MFSNFIIDNLLIYNVFNKKKWSSQDNKKLTKKAKQFEIPPF